jgi:ERF superfamily
MAMIEKAITSGAGIETLERLVALHERWTASEARREYDDAISKARAEIKPILKTREASFGVGKTAYKYEDLADIAEAVDETLSKYGLSYRWEATHEGSAMIVTCIVSHSQGHRERSSLPGRPDTSGSKNDIQALGSAVTYLQRYTLKLALGLAAAKDDDAHAVSAKPASPAISEAQYQSLLKYMKEAEVTPEEVLRHRAATGAEKLTDLTEAQFAVLEGALKNRIKIIKEQKKEEQKLGHPAAATFNPISDPDAPAQS